MNLAKALWRKYVSRPTKFQGSKMPLKYAFTVNGIDYYEPDPEAGGLTQMPWLRALTLHQYYEELRMKVDREYLERHTDAVELIIRGPKDKPKKRFTFDDLNELSKLNNMLKERMNFIFTPDLLYKVCSVVFIDATESPEKYNEAHNRKKIEMWKQHGLEAFFLNEPVQRLIPFLNSSPESIREYGEIVEKMEKTLDKALENISLNGLHAA
jgi:hypothetical protein